MTTLSELKQKKIEVDKNIAEIRKGYHGYRNMDNPKCNEYLLCIKLQAESKALSLGIEVCENQRKEEIEFLEDLKVRLLDDNGVEHNILNVRLAQLKGDEK